MRATASRNVQQSPQQVWEVLSDHAGMTTWAPGLKASVTTAGRERVNGVGAVRRIALPGPAPAIVEEITAFEPDRRLAYRAVSGVPFRDYSGSVELRPAGAGTEIVWTLEARERVPFAEQAALTAAVHGLITMLVRRLRA